MNEKKYTARLYLFFAEWNGGEYFTFQSRKRKGRGNVPQRNAPFTRARSISLSRIIEVRNANSNITCRRQVCTSSGKASKLMAQMKVMREARTYRMLEC